jgi:hypothetical protein
VLALDFITTDAVAPEESMTNDYRIQAFIAAFIISAFVLIM